MSSTRLSLFPALAACPRIPKRSGAEVQARTCRGIAARGKGHPSLSEEGERKKNPRREKCAGREDALVAAASDSISMNFRAEVEAP